jgi:hypothetical protein
MERGAEEKPSTVREIRRKASQIGPAYNKGALQYLPSAGISDGTDRASTTRGRPGQIDASTVRKTTRDPKQSDPYVKEARMRCRAR